MDSSGMNSVPSSQDLTADPTSPNYKVRCCSYCINCFIIHSMKLNKCWKKQKVQGRMDNLKTHALDTKKNKQKKNKTENEQHGPHTNTGAEILKH